ncbi:helix-turn-helix transcriptional regulator, partial [Providencia rettgeri]
MQQCPANDLAKRVNISQQQMSRYERGINKLTIDMIFNISLALECPFERIIRFVIYEVQKSPSDDAISLRNKILA